MSNLTQPLRDEHGELVPHIESILVVAHNVGDVSLDELRDSVDEVLEFLLHHLIPHAEAEDIALYPVVAGILGAPEATATMQRDHLEIERLTHQLLEIRIGLASPVVQLIQLKELRRVLYGLYAIISLHFAKEEELYLPLLEKNLSAPYAESLFSQMHQVASDADPQAPH